MRSNRLTRSFAVLVLVAGTFGLSAGRAFGAAPAPVRLVPSAHVDPDDVEAAGREIEPDHDRDDAKTEQAIQWYVARQGSAAFEGSCELAAESAFGLSKQFADARTNWLANHQVQHPDWPNAPRGALVFYNTSAHGHVALSLGNGQVISTSAGGKIGVVPIGYFQNPLGWTNSPWR